MNSIRKSTDFVDKGPVILWLAAHVAMNVAQPPLPVLRLCQPPPFVFVMSNVCLNAGTHLGSGLDAVAAAAVVVVCVLVALFVVVVAEVGVVADVSCCQRDLCHKVTGKKFTKTFISCNIPRESIYI